MATQCGLIRETVVAKYPHVVNEHALWKLGVGIRTPGPVAPYRYVKDQEKRILERTQVGGFVQRHGVVLNVVDEPGQ